ncbi:MAG TPA: hypothetical protein VL309_03225 [Vicinamibacterales bacterium]|nr:hypothetical protein [Vicinamibacterales bacterium]
MRWILIVALAAAAAGTACERLPDEPLKLEGNRLTVDNRSRQGWSNVEIWLNTYYRVTVPSIPSHGRFQTPLDAFVAGFGQRFDFHRMQIHDLRLTAKLPDGSPLEIKKEFAASGLAGALGGKR